MCLLSLALLPLTFLSHSELRLPVFPTAAMWLRAWSSLPSTETRALHPEPLASSVHSPCSSPVIFSQSKLHRLLRTYTQWMTPIESEIISKHPFIASDSNFPNLHMYNVPAALLPFVWQNDISSKSGPWWPPDLGITPPTYHVSFTANPHFSGLKCHLLQTAFFLRFKKIDF